MCAMDDARDETRRLALESLGDADPTAWFERLYATARDGRAVVPWDRAGPNPLLDEWTARRRGDGSGRRAVVVGAGLGDDAEHLARLGFATTAFDIAPTAVAMACRRFPGSPVRYAVADLFDPPPDWRRAFDLVLESITVQSLPERLHAPAAVAVAGLVAPGGTLLVLSGARDAAEPVDGPPWPLTRAELDAYTAAGLREVRVEAVREPGAPRRWRAEYARPAAG